MPSVLVPVLFGEAQAAAAHGTLTLGWLCCGRGHGCSYSVSLFLVTHLPTALSFPWSPGPGSGLLPGFSSLLWTSLPAGVPAPRAWLLTSLWFCSLPLEGWLLGAFTAVCRLLTPGCPLRPAEPCVDDQI